MEESEAKPDFLWKFESPPQLYPEVWVVAPVQTFDDCKQFGETLKRRLCPKTWDYNVVWRLEQIKMSDGNFQFYHQQFVTGINLLKGTMFDNERLQQYLLVRGLEGDIQAKVMAKHPRTLHNAMELAWEYFRKPRLPPQVILDVPEAQLQRSARSSGKNRNGLGCYTLWTYTLFHPDSETDDWWTDYWIDPSTRRKYFNVTTAELLEPTKWRICDIGKIVVPYHREKEVMSR